MHSLNALKWSGQLVTWGPSPVWLASERRNALESCIWQCLWDEILRNASKWSPEAQTWYTFFPQCQWSSTCPWQSNTLWSQI